MDINDPEQPLLLDAEISSAKSDLATIHSAVSSSAANAKNSSSQEWNITQKQEFEAKNKNGSAAAAAGENNPSSGSPIPSGVIPSGLRSRSPQVNSGWL